MIAPGPDEWSASFLAHTKKYPKAGDWLDGYQRCSYQWTDPYNGDKCIDWEGNDSEFPQVWTQKLDLRKIATWTLKFKWGDAEDWPGDVDSWYDPQDTQGSFTMVAKLGSRTYLKLTHTHGVVHFSVDAAVWSLKHHDGFYDRAGTPVHIQVERATGWKTLHTVRIKCPPNGFCWTPWQTRRGKKHTYRAAIDTAGRYWGSRSLSKSA